MNELNLNGLVQIAKNTPKIYAQGKTEGYQLGAKQLTDFIETSEKEEYVIPDGVTVIGVGAFAYRIFNSVTIPESVKEINDSAFRNCDNLTSIYIPDSVEFIDFYAFQDCKHLKNVRLSENLGSRSENHVGIGWNAFAGCTKLESIKIPDSLKILSTGVFSDCTSLRNVIFGENSQIDYIASAFSGCTSLQNISLPNSLTELRGYSFRNCTSLTSINIPDNTHLIGLNSFEGCTSLKSIVMGRGVTEIQQDAFKGCNSILKYDFSKSVTVPKLKSANGITVNNGTEIVVPPTLYKQWRAATNWAKYKDYIVMSDTKAPVNADNFNIYVDAHALKEMVYSDYGVGKNEVLYENDIPYLRIYGTGTYPEAFSQMTDIEGKTTGKYLVFAYRLPTSNIETHSYFEIFSNTTGDDFSGKGDVTSFRSNQDGKWHVVVMDIAEAIANQQKVVNGEYESKFIANADGTYTIEKLRIDWFNRLTSTDSYVDVAYVGICDTLELAREADANYNSAEFKADYFVSKLGSKAVKNTYNGMEYVTIKTTTQNTGEQFVELTKDEVVLPNVSGYIGILYRDAPSSYMEVWASSNNKVWSTSGHIDYDTADGWHFAVITLKDVYKDSVCRRLRFDYFNNLSANTEYSIDIAFVKSFGSEDEAYEYYKTVCNRYGIPYDMGELEYSYSTSNDICYITGRGTYKRSTIIIPEYSNGYRVNYIANEAFANDPNIDTLILPEKSRISFEYQSFSNTNLRVIKNFYSCSSFSLSNLKIEYISFSDGADIVGYECCQIKGSPIYDFSRHTEVADLGDTSFITVGSDTKIVVPDNLYDEWIEATNWTEFADHICKSSEFNGEY